MSNDLSQQNLEELYEWIDTIPLTLKKKTNLTRDFNDAVLCAEVIAHYFPSIVDLFNYEHALKIETKIYNWNTLNNRVLKQLKYPLDKNTINDLANSKPGTVEKVLWDLHNIMLIKQQEDKKPNVEIINSDLQKEIKEAKQTTDRKVLIAKREECQRQAEEIQHLNEQISQLKTLIKEKEKKLSEVGGP